MSDKNRTKSRRSKGKLVKTRQMILAGKRERQKHKRKRSLEREREKKQKLNAIWGGQ